MFKKISMMLIAAMALITVAAQQTTESTSQIEFAKSDFPKHELGIHGGSLFSFFYNEHPLQNPRNSHRPVYGGGVAGISYQYNFSKMLALRVETNYERKGDVWYSTASWESPYTYSTAYASDYIHYLTIPVTVKASFGKTIRFFINSGLYAGIRINAQRVMRDKRYIAFPSSEQQALTEINSTTNITNDISPMDGGVVFGLGVSFPIENVAVFTIEGRNNTGFVNLNANTGLYQNRFYNNSTELLVGLQFILQKRK